ncbi:hypothetical protein FHG87_006816 [Trinorchestia longiramus]|nr:hypothetical protein FHG87_006816 [Trinorchestia longiramus]
MFLTIDHQTCGHPLHHTATLLTISSAISALHHRIREAERRLREQAKKKPALKLLEEERLQQEEQNKTLSNRIQQTTVRLNAVLADNAHLRSDIESQLKERDKFLLQADRLEKQIAVTAKKKSDVMDVVTKAYSEREEAGGKIRAVRERVMRDSRSHSMELKKLQRVLDHQTHLKSFVTTIAAGEETTKDDGQEAEDRRGPFETLQFFRESLAALISSSSALAADSTLMEAADWDATSEGRQAEGDQPAKDASQPKDSSARRSKVTDEQTATDHENLEKSDIADALLNNFLQSENDNYTIFSFVSGVNNEASGVIGEIAHLKQELQDLQQQQTAEQQRTLHASTTLQTESANAEYQKPKLVNTEFVKAESANAEYQKAELVNAKYQKAELVNAKYQKAELVNAEYQKAELANAKYQKAELVNAKYQKAELVNAEYQKAELVNAEYQKVELVNAEYQKAESANAEYQKDRCDSGERATEEVTAEAGRAEEVLTSMKEAVQDLLMVLRCDTTPLRAVTGGGQVTTSNLSVFLTLIEQRVAELIARLPQQQIESPLADELNERSSAGVSPAESRPLQVIQRPS